MSTLFSVTVNGVASTLTETQVVTTLQPFGLVGPQGPPGNTGATGAQGPAGPNGTDSLFTAAAAEFTVSSGTISLTRVGKLTRYTTTASAGAVGLTEEFALLAPAATMTATLTTDTGCTRVIFSNVGTATATIAAGAGQTIHGGSITLTARPSATQPNTIELWRDPSDNSWWIVATSQVA